METHVTTVTHNIIVLLPGTTGTSLVSYNTLKNGDLILIPSWPDQVIADVGLGLIGDAQKLLATAGLQQDPTGATNPLVAYKPSTGVFGDKGYEPLIDYLTGTVLGNAPYYTWNIANQSVPNASGNLLVGFGYDWRENNTYTAGQLADLLNNIYDTYSANTDSDFRIILIGHSMGGLVARAYLENVGPANQDKVLGKIAALITLGTPHLGAPLALDAIAGNTLVPCCRFRLSAAWPITPIFRRAMNCCLMPIAQRSLRTGPPRLEAALPIADHQTLFTASIPAPSAKR